MVSGLSIFDITQTAILCRVWRVMKMCHTDVYIYSEPPKNAAVEAVCE